MNEKNAPVDVLAVIRRCAGHLRHSYRFDEAVMLNNAGDAVSKVLAAAEAYLEFGRDVDNAAASAASEQLWRALRDATGEFRRGIRVSDLKTRE